jgi:hypothetical protein
VLLQSNLGLSDAQEQTILNHIRTRLSEGLAA